MANRKLSALTEATTIGDDDELLVNDSGVSKRITWATIKDAVEAFFDTLYLTVASTASSAGTLTLTVDSELLQIITGSTTHTVQLPAANAYGAGNVVRFIVKNRSTGNVTIARAGADTIEGATSIVITTGQAVTLMSDGVSEWEEI
jgi:hypothetical protein